MSYEDQLIREATGQSPDFVETDPEETNESSETGDEQGESSYLCGCKYPAAYDAYFDRACATCHREAWTARVQQGVQWPKFGQDWR